MRSRNHVVIVGSGLMGGGIAARSALAGNSTLLTDAKPGQAEKGVALALEALDELAQNGLATTEQAEAAKERLSWTATTQEALSKARLVIEAVYEDLVLKQQVFQQLDAALPPEVPIASNTSGLRITDIAAQTKHPQRCVTTHFWFPAHLVPLVEVVVGDETDLAVALQVKEEMAAWGKAPVLVQRDLPGQLANRILQAIIREAVNIVAMGLASPQDVDTAVKMGMGIRFPAWGPLEHIDAVGLDLATSVQNTVLPSISGETKANAFLETLRDQGNLGYKTGKGFYDWAEKSMDDLAAKRNAFIIHALQMVGPKKEETP